ncbi:hypothetical protein [Pseudorhodoferax sp. Leaf267]|uniref:hypothetical protein n=1 Tax=Pseudorhodoferax sp. Leaf267 TaxID=1736316 RepID=UPI0006F691BB|nr:hypothetical protein [Pseudorhodoferax sp. Leaf267]KQP23336.1 hypothetical protein ASF43_05600 [Pseudorhodoferax sp. Leaf267]
MDRKTPTRSPSPASTGSAAAPRPVVEPGAVGPGATHAVVDGEVAPRLPHERDESSDSGTGEPSERMHQAARDVAHGHVDVPRGPATQRYYSELTEEAQEQGKTDTEPGSSP